MMLVGRRVEGNLLWKAPSIMPSGALVSLSRRPLTELHLAHAFLGFYYLAERADLVLDEAGISEEHSMIDNQSVPAGQVLRPLNPCSRLMKAEWIQYLHGGPASMDSNVGPMAAASGRRLLSARGTTWRRELRTDDFEASRC